MDREYRIAVRIFDDGEKAASGGMSTGSEGTYRRFRIVRMMPEKQSKTQVILDVNKKPFQFKILDYLWHDPDRCYKMRVELDGSVHKGILDVNEFEQDENWEEFEV